MDFADLLSEYFDEAVKQRGLVSECIELAGRQIEFRVAGDRWTSLTGALVRGALRPVGEPGLRVMVWDGEQPPRNHVLKAYLFSLTNWFLDYMGPRGQLLDVQAPGFEAFYVPMPGLLFAVDLRNNTAFCWKRDTMPLPYWEIVSPFRPLLHCWFREQGIQLLHAAAVGTEEGGLLLAGRGGAGKSTTALACMNSGLRYLCDDFCMIGLQGRAYSAFGLYSTAKLEGPADLARFPLIAANVWNPDRNVDDKAAFFLQDHFPESFIDRFPVKGILLPIVTGRSDTCIVPCSGSRAFSALAPSTLSHLPASGDVDFRFLSELSRAVPAYELRLGTDIARIPSVLEHLLIYGHEAVADREAVATK
jgi:hypothetical protein